MNLLKRPELPYKVWHRFANTPIIRRVESEDGTNAREMSSTPLGLSEQDAKVLEEHEQERFQVLERLA
jgi:hypothetical protein